MINILTKQKRLTSPQQLILMTSINALHLPTILATGQWFMMKGLLLLLFQLLIRFQIEFENLVLFAHSHYDKDEFGQWVSQCDKTNVGWWQNKTTGERGCFKAMKINGESLSSDNTAPSDHLKIVQPQFIQKNKKNQLSQNFLSPPTTENFIQTWDDIYLFKEFEQHHKVAERLNSPHIKKSWTAKSHDQWKGKNLGELNKIAGRKKHPHKQFISKKNQQNNYQDFSLYNLTDLPKEFTYAHLVNPAREQGSCGSCYILSTIAMIEARLKIKLNETVKLSPQQPIDCDYYNQGCDGGYPFLVQKFASENELVTEECHPYIGMTGRCEMMCDKNLEAKTYKVTNYRFIGGQYGHSNEKNIMEELLNFGPLVISFEPTYDFMHYNSGIYHSVDANDWIKNGEPKPDWEKVDHSVLLVGWGEENGEKFWQIQNTWGTQWGENGFFRIRRGTDESNIESLAEASDPVIITKDIKNLPSEFFQLKQKEYEDKDSNKYFNNRNFF